MEKVIFIQQNVTYYLENLILLLFEQGYFSFEASAQKYVSNLYDFIENDLTSFPLKKTPHKLSHCGTFYAYYHANPQTTWYVFFEKNENRYLITYITNNHTQEAQFL